MSGLDPTPGVDKARHFQLGFVVRDLDAALEYWTGTVGVGPFVVIRVETVGRRVLHRGREVTLTLDLALAYMGKVQIELIRQVCDTPSPFTEFLSGGHTGLHHLAFWGDAIFRGWQDPATCGLHLTTTFHGPDGAPGIRFFEAPSHLGMVVELVPASPEKAAYFDRLRDLCQKWDGRTAPVRHFADVAAFMAATKGAAG
jgi:catechol 2,3-dioxygenase-like lactoylglutathione lyase family enzyme